MNVQSSSSSYFPNSNPLFSFQSSQSPSSISSFTNSPEASVQSKSEYKLSSLAILSQKPDLATISCEPVKKVKPNLDVKKGLSYPKICLPHSGELRSSLGTIDEVFNAPLEYKPDKNLFFAEDPAEDLDLSSCFSSDSSDLSEDSDFDIINDNKAGSGGREEDNDCIIIDGPAKDNSQLVIKDPIINKLNAINAKNIDLKKLEYSPLSSKLLKMAFTNTFEPKQCDLLNLNSKRRFPFDEEQKVVALQTPPKIKITDLTSSKKVETITISECDDDSESDLTRSTGLGLESRNLSTNDGKLMDIPFSMGFGIFDEKKTEGDDKKRSKSRKSSKLKRVKKERKGEQSTEKRQTDTTALLKKRERSIIVNLGTNSSYWKAERRQNRLQQLKKEQAIMNGQEPVEIMNFLDYRNYKRGKNNQESSDSDSDQTCEEKETPIGQMYQAVIPKFQGNSGKKKGRKVKPLWIPDVVDRAELDKYFNELFQTIEETCVDEEKALKILIDFGMNSTLALADIRQNIPSYKENLRLKIRKSRRRFLL